MEKIISWLNGKKAYLLCLAGLIYALTGWITGHTDAATAQKMIWEALTAAALRAGIAKSGPPQ